MNEAPNEAMSPRRRLQLAIIALKKDHPKALLRHVAQGLPLDSGAHVLAGSAPVHEGSCWSLLEAAALLDSAKCFDALLAAGATLDELVVIRAFFGRRHPTWPSQSPQNPGCEVLRGLLAAGLLDLSSEDEGMPRALATNRPEVVAAVGEALARKEAAAIEADIGAPSRVGLAAAPRARRL